MHRVIGIEILAAAVVDAKRNAEANGIANAEFHAAPVEKVIDTVIAGIGPGRRVVAILDPPRSGVPDTVVRAVRACAAVTTLVYVACDAASASRNLLDLCRVESNRVHGAPFVITAACGVDLFPHTRHCELLVQFKRAPAAAAAAAAAAATATVAPILPATTDS